MRLQSQRVDRLVEITDLTTTQPLLKLGKILNGHIGTTELPSRWIVGTKLLSKVGDSGNENRQVLGGQGCTSFPVS